MTDSFFQTVNSDILYPTIVFVLSAYPIWLPFFLGWILIHMWMYYIRSAYVVKQGSVLLEVKLPRDVTRSPHSMEIFLAALWQKGSVTWIDTYFGGKTRAWFSLEIASIEGQVHFYIWTSPKFKDLIEAQLYGQFPNVEVTEVEDYTKSVVHDLDKMAMWGTYYTLDLPNVYPIKTYVDIGLDKADTKEEFKTDPLASLLEFMGSIGKGEQIWMQIMIQAHRKVGIKDAHSVTVKDWTAKARETIKAIRDSSIIDVGGTKFSNPTKLQNDTIAAIERHLNKWPFDVGMRGIYISTKEANKIAIRVPGVIGAWRAFSGNKYEVPVGSSKVALGFNGIKIGAFTDFDYPWEDMMRMRRTAREKKMLDAYKKRSFFQYPYKSWLHKPFVLTTEEIATIYHFPGQVAQTPTLNRIGSKKTDAPSNIPI